MKQNNIEKCKKWCQEHNQPINSNFFVDFVDYEWICLFISDRIYCFLTTTRTCIAACISLDVIQVISRTGFCIINIIQGYYSIFVCFLKRGIILVIASFFLS